MDELKNESLPHATALGRPLNTNTVIGVYGITGSGKTAWTEEILLRNKERLLIVDTNGHDYGNEDFCKATGISYDAILYDRRDIAEYVSRDKFRIVVRDAGSEMESLNVFVSRNNKRDTALITDCTIAVDELHRFMDAQNIADQISDIVTVGRHSRLDFVGISQIPKGQTNMLYRSMLRQIISFAQIEKGSIDFFKEFDEDKAGRLRTLERGDYELIYGDGESLKNFINKK